MKILKRYFGIIMDFKIKYKIRHKLTGRNCLRKQFIFTHQNNGEQESGQEKQGEWNN